MFHILFIMYFFALVIMPCADKEDCNEYKQTALSQSEHHREHSDEVCTPFCVCACCAAHFVSSYPENHFGIVVVINTVYADHKTSETSDAITAILQPPKLS